MLYAVEVIFFGLYWLALLCLYHYYILKSLDSACLPSNLNQANKLGGDPQSLLLLMGMLSFLMSLQRSNNIKCVQQCSSGPSGTAFIIMVMSYRLFQGKDK